jgi:hypothetical protein
MTTASLPSQTAFSSDQLTLSEADRSRLHTHFAEGGVDAALSPWSATSGHGCAAISPLSVRYQFAGTKRR